MTLPWQWLPAVKERDRQVVAAVAVGAAAVSAVGAAVYCYRRRARQGETKRSESRDCTRICTSCAQTPRKVQWADKRLGLSLEYDEDVMQLKLPVHRNAPFAVMEFDVKEDLLNETGIGAALTVQVHDCSADDPLILEEYVQKSLAALEEMEDETVVADQCEPTLLGNLPAIHFCYYCADGDGASRKVYTSVAAAGKAVYTMSYSSPVSSFCSMHKVREFASRLRITPPEPSDSLLVFTDPKYGVSLQVPVAKYHVESTPAAGGRSWREVVQFSTVEHPDEGASIIRLDAEPADLPVLDYETTPSVSVSPTRERRHKSATAGLRYAAQLYRQQVLQDHANHPEDVVWWARLDVLDETGVLVPDGKGRRVQGEILNSFTRSLTLRGPEEIDAVAFAYHKTCPGNTTLCFIVYMWLQKGDLFVLSAVCHSDQRNHVARSIYEVANSIRYGEKHGQTSSLQYQSLTHSFSLLLPTQLRASEPFIGDPYVIFCVPSGSKPLRLEAEKRWKLLREFYLQIRVLDQQGDAFEGEGDSLQELLVTEMGELAGQEAVVHSSGVTQLGSQPALEVVFTSDTMPYRGCDELAMPAASRATTLRMISIRNKQKFVLEFVASMNQFPVLSAEGVFSEILDTFRFVPK